MATAQSRPQPRSAQRTARREGLSPEEALVADLIALLEQGTTPWRRPWDGSGGGHHVNLLSGHRYRGANPILLTLGMHLRGAGLPFWCGFAEAKRLGVFPLKGSKAVRILRPQLNSREEQSEGSEVVQTVQRSWVSYRPVPVFNVCDLEGEALEGLIAARQAAEGAGPQGATPRPEPERIAAAEAALGAWPVPVSHGGEKAFYLPELDRIQLPDRVAFSGADAFYATWAHEAIHSTGHESRLQRDLGGRMGCPRYAREELIAELGSVLMGQRLEIGCDLANHAAYLEAWVALLKESPRVLFQVLSAARQAADLICPEVLAEEPAAAGAAEAPAG
ncbi:ArdC family protein [Vulcanococcus limneticus]|uniref:ArdC family protein n=1 Tax=Vulcanococcus limneticus TaxID=2170428 RepID=UPI00398BECA7